MTHHIVKRLTVSKDSEPSHYGMHETMRVDVEFGAGALRSVSVQDRFLVESMRDPRSARDYAQYLARDTAHRLTSMIRQDIEDVLLRLTPVVQQGERLTYSRT